MSESFYKELGKISALSSIVPLLVGLFSIKKIRNFLVPIFIIVCTSMTVDIVSFVKMEKETNNLIIFHFFTIIEFVLITIFYSLFFKQYLKSLYLLVMVPVFFIIAYIDYKINGLSTIDNFSASVESMILSLYSLIAFFIVMKKMIFEDILNTSFFWINTAVLIYFSGNLLFFVFTNYLHSSEESNYLAMWTIHSFLNIVYNILISIGFWKTRTL